MIKNFADLLNAAKNQQTMKLAVAAAQDEDVLVAVCKAAEQGLIDPVLVGDIEKVKALAAKK